MTDRTLRCHCGGRVHEVVLTAGGALVLPAHRAEIEDCGGLRAWLAGHAALTHISGARRTACRCAEVVGLWLALSTAPSTLPDVFQAARRAADERRRLRAGRALQPLVPLRERLRLRAEGLLRSALRNATYREGSSRWIDTSTQCFAHVEWDVTPRVWGESETVRHHKHGQWRAQELHLHARVDPGTYLRARRVVPDGLVDGRVVVAVELRSEVVTALVGRQGRGLSVESCWATLRRTETGWTVARWSADVRSCSAEVVNG